MLVKRTVGKTGERLDPRVRRTRELIVRAFGELVEERGHTGLTVQEIAARATVNRATFYAHFADQYELFDYFISESFQKELRSRLSERSGLDEQALRALLLAACDYIAGLNTACSRTDRQFRPLIEARVQGELYELLLGWIEALPPERRPATPEVTSSVVSWAIFGVALDWSRKGAPGLAEEVADQTLPVILDGLQL